MEKLKAENGNCLEIRKKRSRLILKYRVQFDLNSR